MCQWASKWLSLVTNGYWSLWLSSSGKFGFLLKTDAVCGSACLPCWSSICISLSCHTAATWEHVSLTCLLTCHLCCLHLQPAPFCLWQPDLVCPSVWTNCSTLSCLPAVNLSQWLPRPPVLSGSSCSILAQWYYLDFRLITIIKLVSGQQTQTFSVSWSSFTHFGPELVLLSLSCRHKAQTEFSHCFLCCAVVRHGVCEWICVACNSRLPPALCS